MSFMTIRPVALGVAVLLAWTPLPVRAEGDVRTFSNWIVGCDNRAECTAIGHSEPAEPQGTPAIVLRIGVDRSSLTGFRFDIIPVPERATTNRTITVTCQLCAKGLRSPEVPISDQVELRGQRVTLPDRKGAEWLEALGKSRMFTAVSSDGAVNANIASSAFLEAWKYLAVARGALMRQTLLSIAPHTGASSETERKRTFPAVEVIPSGFPGIARLTRKCPADAKAESYRQFMLPGNVSLWAVECSKNDTRTWHWYQASGTADLPAALELPDGDRGIFNAVEHGFEDSVFDFDFGILRARTASAGQEDCGVSRAWGWDGRAWFLLERREMPTCVGLAPPDWIRTYIAP